MSMRTTTKVNIDFVIYAIALNLKELFIVLFVKDVQWVALYILIDLLVLGLELKKYFSYSLVIGP